MFSFNKEKVFNLYINRLYQLIFLHNVTQCRSGIKLIDKEK